MILEEDPGRCIPGETTDDEMSKKQAIEITSFSLSGSFVDTGLDQSSEQKSTPKQDGKPAPKANVRPKDKLRLSVAKNLDSSSNALMIAYCSQLATTMTETGTKPFHQLTIIVRKSGELTGSATSSQGKYLTLTLNDVYLNSYTCRGQGSDTDMPEEDLEFSFKKFSMAYSPQDSQGRLISAKTMDASFYDDDEGA